MAFVAFLALLLGNFRGKMAYYGSAIGHDAMAYSSDDEPMTHHSGEFNAWVAQNEIDKVASGVTSVEQAIKTVKAHVKESGAASCHQFTYEMANNSGKNVSRDFWRFTRIPIVP